jgi:hypothetical protein
LNQRPGAAYSPQRVYQNAPQPASKAVNSGSYAQPQKPVSKSPVKSPASNPANISGKSMQSPAKTMASKPAPSMNLSKSEAKATAKDFIHILVSAVNGFALLSEDVIDKNMKMAISGLSNEERTISFECVDYLMSNLGVIIMGLVLDNTFKESFKEAVMLEMQLDTESPESRAKKREAMKDKKAYTSAGSIVIGVTSFTPVIEDELMNKMQHSFDMMDAYSDEFDTEVAKMTEDRKIEYGFIFSNFMYLIRAFTHNDLFMSYVITVVEKVKDTLKVS